MRGKNDCGDSNLSQSICAIRAMLDDAEKEVGAGGGVTAIRAESSHGYSITLGMEGRAVTYKYEFEFKDGAPPVIKSRTESVETYGN